MLTHQTHTQAAGWCTIFDICVNVLEVTAEAKAKISQSDCLRCLERIYKFTTTVPEIACFPLPTAADYKELFTKYSSRFFVSEHESLIARVTLPYVETAIQL